MALPIESEKIVDAGGTSKFMGFYGSERIHTPADTF
jgi:hypothetical protein